MIRTILAVTTAVVIATHTAATAANPVFVNGLTIPGGKLDATEQPGANAGRLGMFSDIYYDPGREEWWGLSDRGPGGGVLDYATRVQRFRLKVDQKTGTISRFRVVETVQFRDPEGLLSAPTPAVGVTVTKPRALNGLNPEQLNDNVSVLGRSFDPEGIVINPRNANLIIFDEYGPSIYEFRRNGRLKKVFETPANLIPTRTNSTLDPGDDTMDYVGNRDVVQNGRQDNRGFEGLAVTPDGKKLFAVLQDPLFDEGGRDGRNVRIVVFDNDPHSASYGKSIAQYAYPLELQANVRQRILDAGGEASDTDPRQGRNIGLSAIVAINEQEFLVLERDNRGLGVDDPEGDGVIGTKRVYKATIDPQVATNITGMALPSGDLSGTGITPVEKEEIDPFIDLAADTVLPSDKKAEKWEGLAIGPRLKDGSYLILAGTDNDYSVTQDAGNVQFDVYVDFEGNSVQRDIDRPTRLNGVEVGPIPEGHALIPGVLHAYKTGPGDLAGYIAPDQDHDD